MWIQRISFKAFIFLTICSFSAHNAFAENNFATRLPHQQINEDIFQLTGVQNAIIKLCRDLQINTKNRSAQQSFYEIKRYPNLTAKQRSQVYLLEDLIKFNKDLRRRVNYLTIKRNYLNNQFIKDGMDSKTYLRGLRNIESNIMRTYGGKMYSDHPLFEQGDPLTIVYRILNDQKDQLLVRVDFLQEQYRWLTMIKNNQQRQVASQQFDRFSNIVVSRASDNAIGVAPEFSQKMVDQVVFKPSEIITLAPFKEKNDGDLKGRSDLPQVQFNEFKEDLKQKDHKINDLTKQVIDLTLKMSEIEILLNKKAESSQRLKAELNDTNQRFMLGKRIIQEKDEEIRSLQITRDQMKARSNGVDHVSYSRDKKVTELSGMLEIYKYKLTEKNHLAKEKTKELARAQNDLRFLGDRIAKLNSELSEIKKQSEQDGSKSPEMENKVWDLQSKIEDIQHFLLENLGDSDKIKSRQRFESSDLSR